MLPLERVISLLFCIVYLIQFTTTGAQYSNENNQQFNVEVEEIIQAAEALVRDREEMRSNAESDSRFSNTGDRRVIGDHKLYRGNRKSYEMDKRQDRYEEMAKMFKKRKYNPEQLEIAASAAIRCSNEEEYCDPSAAYRTYDGSCNNLQNPEWGKGFTCFKRLMEPHYADGISEIRKAKSGNDLPTPRDVSLGINGFYNDMDEKHSHMTMEYGEFLISDFMNTLGPTKADGTPITCCRKTNDPQCGDIKVRKDDHFYRAFNVTCLQNPRKLRCDTCSFGPRIQINGESSYIDGSVLYGATENDADELRTFKNGQLQSYHDKKYGELMPRIPYDPNNSTCRRNRRERCFKCGNANCNLHPGIAALITTFQRLHNKMAQELAELNSHWNDERLYQETRRILGAILQSVTYKEFIPLLIGPEAMTEYQLLVGGDTEYDPTEEAGLFIEFSTVAYRLGHTLIAQLAEVHDNGGIDSIEIRDFFSDTYEFYHGQFQRVTKGLIASPCSKFDRYFVKDVTNHVKEEHGACYGLDLAAIDIYRGRDHGIPPYTDVVKYFEGPDIKSFVDLETYGLFPKGLAKVFESVYESVEDIDYITGGISESPCPGCLVSAAFKNVLAIQFYKLKFGDRFFFEHVGQPTSFATAQRNELRKVTLGDILCYIDVGIQSTQKNVLLLPNELSNPQVACKKGSIINFKYWKDTRN